MKRFAAERPTCNSHTHDGVVRAQLTHSLQRASRGFSLLELIVVIGVVSLLAGLLMPTLRHVHENANRVICLAHLQQLGQAFMMYATQNKDELPVAEVLLDGTPYNLMAAHRPGHNSGWDGIGLLYSGGFCPAVECFYCPSHRGQHNYERYADRWFNPAPNEMIFTNYHYAGHVDWTTNNRRRLDDGHSLVLATDGLRTIEDFNHVDGMNVLRGDGSANWRSDTHEIRDRLPTNESQLPAPSYDTIWNLVSMP